MKTLMALAAVAIMFAAPARADSNDDAYVNALHDRGIEMTGGDSELIRFGHLVCQSLAGGYSMNAIEDMADMHERNGIGDDDVQFMIKSAAATYCPQYIS